MYANARSVLDHPRADLDQALPYGCENALEDIDQPRAYAIATAVSNVLPPQLCRHAPKRERSDEEGTRRRHP
jgi:hypothetical protein